MELTEIRDVLKARKLTNDERQKVSDAIMKHYKKRRKDLSAFQISSSVREAVYTQSPSGQAAAASMYEKPEPEYWYVDDVYPLEGYAVICVGKNLHYKVPFTIGDDDTIMLAPKEDWKKVVYKWVEEE